VIRLVKSLIYDEYIGETTGGFYILYLALCFLEVFITECGEVTEKILIGLRIDSLKIYNGKISSG
jgi:hypothetical protein